jgi:hypothetical protein
MEAIFSSETSDDLQWTTQRYIPEDSTLQFIINLLVNKWVFFMTKCVFIKHINFIVNRLMTNIYSNTNFS